MTDTMCGPHAAESTRVLGFDCADVSTVASLRFPWDLTNWTMPLLELLVIGGAVFALVHAVRRYRNGDPVNLALWCASLVYLFVIEPPLYFPEWFGLDELYGFIFAHNRFSVQFMADRLPLYIVAFYPMISQLAYELVRALGIFRWRGALAGSVAVALACQVFYEIFDHVGPQLKWWTWNDDNHIVNHPAMASVPMTSMLLFASVSMAAMTYLVVRLTGRPAADGRPRRGWDLVLRVLLAGVLTPVAMVIANIPSSLFGGANPDVTAQAWILGIELALIWLAGGWVVVAHLSSPNRGPGEPLSAFARFYPAIYLGAMAVFWGAALPQYLGAEDGITRDGTPTGSGIYALACFLGAGLLLVALHRTQRTRRTDPAGV
ncbi:MULTISPECIES: DUF7802 domain-containing protein [Prauserella salsuginis group]|uniref:DUF7802 domain-containing protein n=2 Tax=Prauserella salsuginis group TaxID=2893672 RepID=A0A839XLU4_9PSEU|nr:MULTISPECIES: hypothetical protein [Prauserella salsuginis group]MBB3663597.1 hypothetical protein [Prauserella sediminis]MCR3722621.1 hypothetical protein [Prauserella flava]MCR3737063.1 hypothetical protein [Prauserella salsuginis]